MKFITLIFLPFLLICSNAIGQEVMFSSNELCHEDSLWLELKSTTNDPIFYSFIGPPVPGQSGTFQYNDPFLVNAVSQDLKRISDMSPFVGTTRSTTFYHPGEYNLNALSSKSDTRKTINVFAGTGDCDDVFIRSFCIGKLPPPVEWQLDIIFDEADEWWDSNTGHYTRGEGLQIAVNDTVLSNMGIDTLKIPNFGIYASKHLFDAWYDSVYSDLPEHLMRVGAKLIAYKNNAYFGTYDIEIRTNGNSSNDYPLKPLVIHFDDSDSPFGKSVKLRKTSTHGIAHLIMDAASMNPDEYDIPVSDYLSFKARSWIYLDNGSGFGEELGEYVILEKNGRRAAKERFGISGKVGKAEVATKKSGGFLSKEDSVFRQIVELFSDSARVNKMTIQELSELVNFESVMTALVTVSIGRVHDSWTHNLLAYYSVDKQEQIFAETSDEDGFGRLFRDNRLECFKINYLDCFLNGKIAKYGGVGYFDSKEDMDNWPSHFALAVLNHSDKSVRNYYQNMLIDIAHSYRKGVMKPLVEKEIDDYFKIFSETMKIDKINGDVDSLYMMNVFNEHRYYAEHMLDAWLLDWIKVFHPKHDSGDVFKIYGHLDAKAANNGERGGKIIVNSYIVNDDNFRLHVREFDVKVEARPNLGWKFSHWMEYPDSAATFLLYQTDTADVHLTPVFTFVEDFYNGQDQLVLNEVLPWSENGADALEVHNPTSEPVSMAGMYLTDKKNRLKHTFSNSSSLMIPAGEYLVITFKSESQNEIYTISEFKLNKEGESLFLYDQDSTLVAKVSWESSSFSGQTFGKCPNVPDSEFLQKLKSASLGEYNQCSDPIRKKEE